MGIEFAFCSFMKEINKKTLTTTTEIKNIKDNIKSPLQQSNHTHGQTETMIRNKSVDDFMKHHVPWIL